MSQRIDLPRDNANRLSRVGNSYPPVFSGRESMMIRFRKPSSGNLAAIVCFADSATNNGMFMPFLQSDGSLNIQLNGATDFPIGGVWDDDAWHTLLCQQDSSGNVDVYCDSTTPIGQIPAGSLFEAPMLPTSCEYGNCMVRQRGGDQSFGYNAGNMQVADLGVWARSAQTGTALDQAAIDALMAGALAADVTPGELYTLVWDFTFRTTALDGWSQNGNCQFDADNPGAAPGPVAPTFTGPDIPNQSGEVDQPFSLDVSGLFDPGDGTPLGNGGWGLSPISGLSISAVGVIEGSPDTVGSAINRNVSLSTDAGTAQSNEFNFETTAAPGVTVYTVAADPVAGTDSILESSGCGIGNDVEVPTQTVQGNAITWYTPFDGTFLINNATGQKTFTARSRVDSGSAWTPAATFTVN